MTCLIGVASKKVDETGSQRGFPDHRTSWGIYQPAMFDYQRESFAPQKKLGETVNIEFATKHNWEKMDVGKIS